MPSSELHRKLRIIKHIVEKVTEEAVIWQMAAFEFVTYEGRDEKDGRNGP